MNDETMNVEGLKISEPKTSELNFSAGGEELIKLSKDGFFYRGERVDDIHEVYRRFSEWLNKSGI